MMGRLVGLVAATALAVGAGVVGAGTGTIRRNRRYSPR